ncbi:MAG: ATP-dependent Clp protease ATP-binding subunit, partial [Oscillospiraceae bacterium]|nr:ATP-dependent Clp protease ATP-binding subunit [Oscillospiraceae bacterium]
MQPKLCAKCKKNIAVVFITKVENGVTMNEGYCLKCARSLGIPQIDQAVKQMGFSEEDLDNLSDEMSNMFGQIDHDEDDMDSQTATFPLLNQLFGSANPPAPANQPVPRKEQTPEDKTEGEGPRKKHKKHKFLDSYCMDLTGRAREGKLDKVIGRDVETERVIQILNRRQKNNPCLIGEPGVGKTAIA